MTKKKTTVYDIYSCRWCDKEKEIVDFIGAALQTNHLYVRTVLTVNSMN